MEHLVIELPGACRAVYDDTLCSIIVTWLNFYGVENAVRLSTQAQLETARQKKVRSIIVDSSQVRGIVAQDDHQWLAGELYPKLAEAGVHAIVTIVPKSTISKLASDQWSSQGALEGLAMHQCATLEEARERAASYM